MKNLIKKAIVLFLTLSILVIPEMNSRVLATSTIFSDVKSTSWYYSYVTRLAELKITGGYTDGTFRPNNSVTRAEFVTFLCNVKGYKQMQGNPFEDSQNSWASGYITAALNNGIIDLTEDRKFRPNDAATRQEVVEMICKALYISPDETTKTLYADIIPNSGYSTAAYNNFLMRGSEKDGKIYFKPQDKLTRAEAAAVIVNVYDYNVDKLGFINRKIIEERQKAAEAEKTQKTTEKKPATFNESVNFLKQQGILNGISESAIKATDSVTKEQYLKFLIMAVDKNSAQTEDYINTAINLGILKNGEVNQDSKDSKIKRSEMAKWTLRAYEKLNNVQYPDYLEAYKTMVTDYKTLNKEDKTNSLKCVSEGLLTPANGEFKPNDTCTNGTAALVLHRLLSAEQREIAKPIFATPDKEFEEFLSKDNYQNAVKVFSMWNIDRVVDGKILWDTEFEGVCLLPTLTNRHSNKEAYEAIKALVYYARKHGNHVEGYYSYGGDDNYLQIFYTNQNAAQKGKTRVNYNFSLFLRFNNDKIRIFNDPGEEKMQNEKTDYRWCIVHLYNNYTNMFPKSVDEYQSKEIIEPLTGLLNVLYEPKLADYLLKYIVKENRTRNEYNWESKDYTHKGCIYPSQFKGLEVQVKQDGALYLGTNKIN